VRFLGDRKGQYISLQAPFSPVTTVTQLEWILHMTISSASSQEQPASEIGLIQEQPARIVSTQQAFSPLRAFIALRHRNYRLFWFGQMISLIGTWMQSTGQAWLVLELTHSAWQLGTVGALLK
jgi:hypothetical protein